jgi:hexokinase
MNENRILSAFLGQYGFDSEGVGVNGIIDALLYDMERGLRENSGETQGAMASSHAMIPTWMLPPETSPKNQSVVVIDAGGTNFRSCLVSFDGSGKSDISLLQRSTMPAIDRELSKSEFYGAMAENLAHLKNKATRVGFCFSYPMKILPDGDGEVIYFSKEVKAPEVIGTKVGANLAASLAAKGWNRPEKITLLNDTVAALLAGAANIADGRRYDSFVGLILGTGMNTAYIESGTIPKIAGVLNTPKSQIIVCESGNFNKVTQSAFDLAADKKTTTPGVHITEKMCSGGYIGQAAGEALKQAATDGLFSSAVACAFGDSFALTLKDMDQFLYGPYRTDTLLGEIAARGTDADYHLLYGILDAFVERCARFMAALIAASVIKSGKGAHPARPVCVLCEGTAFAKTHNLKPRIIGHLEAVLTKERHLYYELVSFDNAITVGTAIAGLCG